MRLRRLGRSLLEAAFLAGLAALATIARMRPEAVIAVMAFGWVVVALAEWSSWLDRPHFGRGLPPRFYVPQVSLPPAQPLEQRPLRLPSGRSRSDEAETWIAPTRWAASLEEWPVIDLEQLGEEIVIAPRGELAELSAPERDPATGEETELLGPGALVEDTLIAGPPPARPEPEADEVGAEVLTPEAATPSHEPLAPIAPPADPLVQPARPPGEPPPQREAPVPIPPLPLEPAERATLTAAAGPRPLARHQVDPFAPVRGASRWRRRRQESGGVVEVEASPPADRPLPAAERR